MIKDIFNIITDKPRYENNDGAIKGVVTPGQHPKASLAPSFSSSKKQQGPEKKGDSLLGCLLLDMICGLPLSQAVALEGGIEMADTFMRDRHPAPSPQIHFVLGEGGAMKSCFSMARNGRGMDREDSAMPDAWVLATMKMKGHGAAPRI